MKTILDNLINGNLTEARKGAQGKHISRPQIARCLVAWYGYSVRKAQLAANYLKTGSGFQAYCDAN